MSQLTFEKRCEIAQQCLPPAPYRDLLTVLHTEMLAELKRLLAAEAEWAALSQDDGKAQGEIDRLRAMLVQTAQREPLTAERAKTLMVEAGYGLVTPQEQADFLNGLRHAEIAHGITKGATQVDAALALRKALKASTQPVANPVEIDGIKTLESGGIKPSMVWQNGAPVDLAAAAADALKWLDLLDKMVGMGRAKFTDPDSRNLLGNARVMLAQFLPQDARTKQIDEPTGGAA